LSSAEKTSQPDDFASLYRNAFKESGARTLWSMRPVDAPTQIDELAITQALRTHGGMDGRRLAKRIEKLCRATRKATVLCATYSSGTAQP